MPRYFFNIRDGSDLPDTTGVELPNLDAAKAQAVRVSAEALRDLGADFWKHGDWRLDVTDAQGVQVIAIKFSGQSQNSN